MRGGENVIVAMPICPASSYSLPSYCHSKGHTAQLQSCCCSPEGHSRSREDSRSVSTGRLKFSPRKKPPSTLCIINGLTASLIRPKFCTRYAVRLGKTLVFAGRLIICLRHTVDWLVPLKGFALLLLVPRS